ncbi:MAG: hypothetical protein E7460_02900 [Ruminococcaceae bacterium]|nr:hypothetical protein [Oscillospiraceae bacterium]MBQ8897459.1 hypothetical protein [Clostridia bacterium]
MEEKNVKIPGQLDFENIRTWSVKDRVNLVRIDNLFNLTDEFADYENPDFDTLVSKIIAAKEAGAAVIMSIGAHVIKNNLSRFLIALIKEGYITHLSGNGACSIHDFELCYNGGTSENVPTAIEDGSFGMWEETGAWMNEAIQEGAKRDLGYGEALAVYVDEHPEKFPYRDDCVFYQAWKHGVPATYHIALGTDIIHEHPSVDFAAIGKCSGIDFHKYCYSMKNLENGVFMNFGSGVIGPEVFLKALSIVRNLGYPSFHITTGNFDLIDLGDYRSKIGYDDPNYYYRPRKNIVNRPTSVAGQGWHFVVDHKISIPNLYFKLKAKEGK